MHAAKIDALNSPALNSRNAYCPNGFSASAASLASSISRGLNAIDRARAGHDDEERDHRSVMMQPTITSMRDSAYSFAVTPFSTTADCR